MIMTYHPKYVDINGHPVKEDTPADVRCCHVCRNKVFEELGRWRDHLRYPVQRDGKTVERIICMRCVDEERRYGTKRTHGS